MNILNQKLSVLCNSCGKLMKDMGEWPVQFPTSEEYGRVLQCRRFSCNTCRVPSDKYANGYPVMIAIVDDGNLG